MFQNQKTRQRTWSENEDVKFVISLLMIFPWLAHSRNATIYFWNEKKVISHCDEFLQFHFSHPPVCYSELVRIVESVVVERVQSRPSDKANVARCIDQAWKLSAFFFFSPSKYEWRIFNRQFHPHPSCALFFFNSITHTSNIVSGFSTSPSFTSAENRLSKKNKKEGEKNHQTGYDEGGHAYA